MKNLYMYLIMALLTVSIDSYSFTTAEDLYQETENKNPFKITTQETTGTYQLILDEKVDGDQGILTLTDDSGKVIFQEEVEVLEGLVIRTFKKEDLQKVSAGLIRVELQSANNTYNATFTL